MTEYYKMTPQEYDYAKDQYINHQRTARNIAKEIGCNHLTLQIRFRNDPDVKIKFHPSYWTDERLKILIDNYDMPIKDIQQLFPPNEVTCGAIIGQRAILRRKGLLPPSKRKRK